jgi:iron(II)-dependent oxidoreductase
LNDNRKDALAIELNRVRDLSLQLINQVPAEHLGTILHPDFRPLRWHIGHVGMFESWWILQQIMGGAPPDEQLAYLYSTEYPREQLHDLPTVETAIEFSRNVREQVLDYLQQVDLDHGHPLTANGYIFENIITHEYQHTETIAYLMQMIDPGRKVRELPSSVTEPPPRREIAIPGGTYTLGRLQSEPLFSYDNEWPRHAVELGAFLLDEYPTTNAEYLEFVEDDGYRNRELWSADGWAWLRSVDGTHPLYWRRDEDGAWLQQSFSGSFPLPRDHPVMLVGWYEAEAYARYRGKRLPTEAEWEIAAAWSPEAGRQLIYPWGDDPPTPDSAHFGDLQGWSEPVTAFRNTSPFGLQDMIGNIWEWTSTPFDGYPGFKPHPYPEYSQVWFDGFHRIARGGCFVTHHPMLRATFRNWFYPRTRERFIGIRLAKDA